MFSGQLYLQNMAHKITTIYLEILKKNLNLLHYLV